MPRTSRMVGIFVTIVLALGTLVSSGSTEVISPKASNGRDAASRLLTRAVTAFGGPQHLDNIRSMRFQGLLDLFDPEGDVQQADSSTVLVGTDCLRQERRLDDGTYIVRGLSGPESFLATNGQEITVPEGLHEELRAELLHRRTIILRMRNEASLRHLGATRIAGQTVGLVEVNIRDVITTLGIDPESGAIRLLRYEATSFDGRTGEVDIAFRDFRMVNGMLLPLYCKATFDGRPLFASASQMTASFNTDDASACQFET